MRHSFKVMHDELYTVKVRISSGWVRWVGEKIWQESRKMTKLPDGSLEMTFRAAGLDEIRRWVLSFRPEAIVLEPEKLDESSRLADALGIKNEIRMLDANTLIGKWVSSPQPSWLSTLLQKALYGYLEPGKGQFVLYYFLKKGGNTLAF